MKLLFLGDSITDCYHSFDPENLGDGYVRRIYEQFSSLPGCETTVVSNKGIDGFTIERVCELWQDLSGTEKESCDIVSVLIGVNDVGVWMNCGYSGQECAAAAIRFQQCYDDLVSDILDYGIPKLVLIEPFLFPCPEKYVNWQPYVKQLGEITARTAQKYRLSHLAIQDQLLSAAKKPDYSDITLDGIHLTEKGHDILARAWMNLT
ncbi:MAG: GDSL-type esterase/lipase family protein [Lachnospiraceae bacterium]|nr:GDSL-type esterase/lipase family protein [Lachnospiraceae bacterium]MDD3796137.1 GDSL-type esterase/lipase family protein [Lachnospiraceae bacterium]